jgi:Flp pilus assembly protein TadD
MNYRVAFGVAALAFLSGCRAREITSLERKEAANVLSEADFAVNMKDWSRAEGLFAKAAAICPDEGGTWVNLGITRMRLHDSSGAKSAYTSALKAYKDEYKRNPTSSLPVIRRAYVLVILGRTDDARSLIEEASAKNPEDRQLRAFTEAKGIDRIVADPALKELSP